MREKIRFRERRIRFTLIPVDQRVQAGEVDEILARLLSFTGQPGADLGWPEVEEPGWPEVEIADGDKKGGRSRP